MIVENRRRDAKAFMLQVVRKPLIPLRTSFLFSIDFLHFIKDEE